MDSSNGQSNTWRAALRKVGAGGRRWRKSQVAPALAAYSRVRDLPRLTGLDAAQLHRATREDILTALKARARAERRLRSDGHWAFSPERLRSILAAWIVERRTPKW